MHASIYDIGHVFLFFILNYGVIIFSFLISVIAFKITNINFEPENINKVLFTSPYSIHKNTVHFALSSLILSPVIEELMFRYHLKKFTKNFFISILTIFIVAIYSYSSASPLFFVLCVYGIILTSIYYGTLYLPQYIKKRLPSYIFTLSIIFFVLGHLNNVKIFSLKFWPIYMLYLFYLTSVGFFLAKIRIKLNFYYTLLLHFLFNLFPYIISFLFLNPVD